jgi:hypothetical protein
MVLAFHYPYAAFCRLRQLVLKLGDLRMKLSKYAQNLTAAKDGVEIDLGEGLFIRVARSNNEKYNDYLKKALKPYERQLRMKQLPDATFEKIYNQAIAETVILGWKGLEDADGKDIPYSKEKVVELLADPVYSDFKELLLGLASEQAVFAAESVADTKSGA